MRRTAIVLLALLVPQLAFGQVNCPQVKENASSAELEFIDTFRIENKGAERLGLKIYHPFPGPETWQACGGKGCGFIVTKNIGDNKMSMTFFFPWMNSQELICRK